MRNVARVRLANRRYRDAQRNHANQSTFPLDDGRRRWLSRCNRASTFLAAVGADSETKQELEPALAHHKTVVDIVEQCASIGELHHAIASDLMTEESVHAELGEVIAGIKPGRTSSDEIIIFDSTGMALQDVITAATIYIEKLSTKASVALSISRNSDGIRSLNLRTASSLLSLLLRQPPISAWRSS